MKILWLPSTTADFRKGIDGLAQECCKEVLKHDPFGGQVFVFRNRPATSSWKVLVYDGQGFWLCHKRLSSGKFRWWPTHATAAARTLAAHQLQVLLSAGNPRSGASSPAVAIGWPGRLTQCLGDP